MRRLPPLLPIFLIVLVDVFGLTLVIPLLTIYAEHFHASAFQATLLVSVYAACQLVSGPILGSLSDRYGRKPLLLVSQLGTFFGFVLMAKANTLWMLYAARALDGATAGNISLAQAYVSDHTKPEERTKYFALIGISFGLGFFVGPLVSGVLAQRSINAPIWLAAGMSATSIVCTLVLLPGGRPAPELARTEAGYREPADATDEGAAHARGDGPGGRRVSPFEWQTFSGFLRRPVLSKLFFEFLCYMLSFSVFQSGFALFAERSYRWRGHPFTPREVGYTLAYAGFLGIVLQGGLMGRLVKRFGETALVRAGFLTMIVAYALLGGARTVAGLVAVTTISAFGNGVLRPALTGLVSQNAGKHEQGTALGMLQSISSIAGMIAPPLGGLLLNQGWLLPWALLASAFAAGGLALSASRQRETVPAEPTA